jgi:hypothetical protein
LLEIGVCECLTAEAWRAWMRSEMLLLSSSESLRAAPSSSLCARGRRPASLERTAAAAERA